MTTSGQAQRHVPARSGQLAMRRSDLRVVQRASTIITDLGRDLDRQLEDETRPSERLRMLREATNRIIREANDAVHAYTRASRAISAELARPTGNADAADAMKALLDAARLEVMTALEVAQRRYPWADASATGRPTSRSPRAR